MGESMRASRLHAKRTRGHTSQQVPLIRDFDFDLSVIVC